MPHGDLAQLSAVIGGLGAAAMLLSRTRAQLLAGLAVTAVGEATLAAALVPGADLKLLVAPAGHAAALVVGVLLVAVARSPFRLWHPRALATTLVALAGVFSAVALFQRLTHGHLLAGDVARANAYTTYFRVTSLFKDPSIFGRHVVIAIAVLLVAIWLGRIRFWLGAGLIAFLWAALLFAYSQSSFAALFAVGVAVSFVLGGPKLRRVLVVGAAACVIAGAAFVAATAVSDSARKATSGRTRLARVTWIVFEHHPLAGVGIGGQPAASKEEAKTRLSARRDRSHTTPLTVAAELGLVGLVVYVALMAAATRLLFLLSRQRRALGLGAASVFLALFVP